MHGHVIEHGMELGCLFIVVFIIFGERIHVQTAKQALYSQASCNPAACSDECNAAIERNVGMTTSIQQFTRPAS